MAIPNKIIFLSALCAVLASCGGSSGGSNGTPTTNNNTGGNTANTVGAATLNWSPPIENTDSTNLNDLTGYKVYYGTQADNLTETISIDNINLTSYMIENLNANTTYYFSITAVNSQGMESAYSNVVSKAVN